MKRFVLALLVLSVVAIVARPAPQPPRLWVYTPTNLLVDKNADDLVALLQRAAKAGYSAALLSDSKFGRLGEMPKRYFENVERVKKAAADAGIEIVPAVFPLGYSEAILSQDPNLAEGLPVRDAPFVVKGGEARLVPDRRELHKPDWKDDNMAPEGTGWRVTDPAGKNARVVFKCKVEPYRQYHVSARLMTKEFRGEPRIQALVGDRGLIFSELGVKPTQDWTDCHAAFNSLENTEVGLYFGAWGAGTGTLAWADLALEEAGLLNVVRRPGAPLVVKTEDGRELSEGKDFEPVADPRMGTVPWKGGYEVWHEPPAIKTNLPDGTRLRVSYFHAITVMSNDVMICPSEPKTLEVLQDHARRVHAAFASRGYFMSHDEIRTMNQDDACRRRNLDAGAILADNARACAKMMRDAAPRCDLYVWSDMFDPHHNAHRDYYLVRGDLAGSWEGLDKDVIVAAWYYEKREEGLKFFTDRGHRVLIAGYYDAPVEQVRDWLASAEKTHAKVAGVMYTTWRDDYSNLERFADAVRAYK